MYPGLSMIVRAKADGVALLPAIKDVVYGAGNDQPVYDVRTMQDIMSESITWQRFHLFLLGAFALLALLLAAVGINTDRHLADTDMYNPFGLLRAGASRCRRRSDDCIKARI